MIMGANFMLQNSNITPDKKSYHHFSYDDAPMSELIWFVTFFNQNSPLPVIFIVFLVSHVKYGHPTICTRIFKTGTVTKITLFQIKNYKYVTTIRLLYKVKYYCIILWSILKYCLDVFH